MTARANSRRKASPFDVMASFSSAARAGYLCVGKLTDVEIEDGWKLCAQVGPCPRVPKGWSPTAPHAHRGDES